MNANEFMTEEYRAIKKDEHYSCQKAAAFIPCNVYP
jgi:hypothetical protein